MLVTSLAYKITINVSQSILVNICCAKTIVPLHSAFAYSDFMVLYFSCIAESLRYQKHDASVSFCGKNWLGEKDSKSNNSQEQILLTS